MCVREDKGNIGRNQRISTREHWKAHILNICPEEKQKDYMFNNLFFAKRKDKTSISQLLDGVIACIVKDVVFVHIVFTFLDGK